MQLAFGVHRASLPTEGKATSTWYGQHFRRSELDMIRDLIFIFSTLFFFTASVFYVRACERLK